MLLERILPKMLLHFEIMSLVQKLNFDLPVGLVNRGLVSFLMNESFSNSFL